MPCFSSADIVFPCPDHRLPRRPRRPRRITLSLSEKPAHRSGRASSTKHIAFTPAGQNSDRQLFPAATAAGSQHTAAVLGGHAGTEAVHLAPLTLLGLVCTEHDQHSLSSTAAQLKSLFRETGAPLTRRSNSIQNLQTLVKHEFQNCVAFKNQRDYNNEVNLFIQKGTA